MNFSSFLRPTNQGLGPADAAKAGEDLAAILTEARPAWVEAVTTFSGLREQVLFEMQNLHKVYTFPNHFAPVFISNSK